MDKIKEALLGSFPGAQASPSVDATHVADTCVVDEDAQLMLRYASGDAHAFDILYARHKAPLYRYLLRHCRDRPLADDVFQDVWGRIIRHRKSYQPRAKFATFLYRIAHNCAIDQFRMRARRRPEHLESVEDNENTLSAPDAQRPDNQLAGAQFRRAFQLALETLPDDQRIVFSLYEESGLSLEEIAHITGVGAETAKSRLRYAVNKLRKALGSADAYFSHEGETRAATRLNSIE